MVESGPAAGVIAANFVGGSLGYQDILSFDEMELNLVAASDAIERECARPLGLSTVEAAFSIVEIANASMSERSSRLDGSDALKQQQPVYFDETDGFVNCPVYDRYRLGAGTVVQGPAIVEELDSTTVIHPGYEATTSDTGFLVITRVEAARPKRKGPPIRETAVAGAGPEQV